MRLLAELDTNVHAYHISHYSHLSEMTKLYTNQICIANLALTSKVGASYYDNALKKYVRTMTGNHTTSRKFKA